MKKILFVLISILVFVACGDNNPKSIAKDFIESAYNGKVENMMKHLDIKDNEKEAAKGKLSMMVLAVTDYTNKNEGIKEVKVMDIQEQDDNAKVSIKVIFNNKEEKIENVKLYKKDKKWFIKL